MADQTSRQASRDDRLKAALRENLRRRKAQARGRADAPGDELAGSEPRQAKDRDPL